MNYPAPKSESAIETILMTVGLALMGFAALAGGTMLIVGGLVLVWTIGAAFYSLPVYAAWWLLASAGLVTTWPTLFQSFAIGALCMVLSGIVSGNSVKVKVQK